MNNKEWRETELNRFLEDVSMGTPSYESIQDFSAWLEWAAEEQTGWIINGTYGAGACLYLRKTLAGITPRCNAEARIGQALLTVWSGSMWNSRDWHKLTPKAQKAVRRAVKVVMKAKDDDWAIEEESS